MHLAVAPSQSLRPPLSHTRHTPHTPPPSPPVLTLTRHMPMLAAPQPRASFPTHAADLICHPRFSFRPTSPAAAAPSSLPPSGVCSTSPSAPHESHHTSKAYAPTKWAHE
eukprot:scaffold1733_cov123-Isochrysis_galbana.AAC.7